MDKVLPYEKILPKELYKDLLKSFLSLSDPNSKPIKITINSKIITYQHAELISKWIDRQEITDELKSSYEFKLLYRGSRDGLTVDKFHEFCDNIPRTVTIVKVDDSNEILGGYKPIEWKSNGGYCKTKDSFIFSFNNDEIILSRVMNENNAIFNSRYHGPSFGEADFHILRSLNNNGYCKKSSYGKSIRKTEENFAIEEMEVFQIMRD